MKQILISIKPEWCNKIFSGEKTIEVRKTAPKLKPPFKCYVYETKARFIKSVKGACTTYGYGRGKVIGSFICDRINEIYQCNSGWVKENACLSRGEFFDYLGIPRDTHGGYDKKAFGWHITEPKLFDKPRELSQFYIPCKWYEKGNGCPEDCTLFDYIGAIDETDDFCQGKRPINRPPQSWCYIEERE